jgi:hypothetical protein
MASTAAGAAEKMIKEALLSAGYPDRADMMCKSLLLQTANTFRKGSMRKVEQSYAAERKTIRWQVAPNRFILDRLFAIDSLIFPGGGIDKQFAFDVTLDPTKVAEKADKHRHLFHIWDEAGLRIHKSAIILLVPGEKWGNEWGWGLLNAQQQEDFTEEVLQVVYGMDERSATVTTYVINF